MFKKMSFSVALWLAVSAGLHATTKSQPAIKTFNEGVALVNAQDYTNAAGHFEEAIEIDPDFAEAYYLRGVCRYSLKGLDGAILDLSDAIRLDPTLIAARSLRGLAYYDSGQNDQALEDLNYALERKPTDAQALTVRGVIELKQEDSAGAVRDFRALLKAHPDDPMAPKIRELLASLGGAPAAAKTKTAHRRPTAETSESASAPPAAPAGNEPTPTINTRALAEKFGQQLLQGDRSPVAPSSTIK